MTKAVTRTQKKEVAAFDYGDVAGDGFENRGSDDISLPYLNILQSTSPAVAEEVEGAKPGYYFNSVTSDISAHPRFVWCYDELKYVEWVPRDSGGGIAGVHEPGSPAVTKALAEAGGKTNKLRIGNNDLVETRNVYGLQLDDDDAVIGFAVFAAKSTNLSPTKKWLTAMMMVAKGAPIYAFRAELHTDKRKNDQGTWYQLVAKPLGGNWKASMINPATHGHILEEARSLREMIQSGAAQVDYSAAGPADKAEPEEVPF